MFDPVVNLDHFHCWKGECGQWATLFITHTDLDFHLHCCVDHESDTCQYLLTAATHRQTAPMN